MDFLNGLFSGDVLTVWSNSLTNVRTSQVTGLLVEGFISLIFTIISTVLQVLIIKLMTKTSKLSGKLSLTKGLDFVHNVHQYNPPIGFFVVTPSEVRNLKCCRFCVSIPGQSHHGYYPTKVWKRTSTTE